MKQSVDLVNTAFKSKLEKCIKKNAPRFYKKTGINLKNEIDEFMEYILMKYEGLTFLKQPLKQKDLDKDFLEWAQAILKMADELLHGYRGK